MLNMDTTILFAGIAAFSAVVLLTLAVGRLANRLRTDRRLQDIVAGKEKIKTSIGLQREASRMAAMLEAFSRLSIPAGGWESSSVRMEFLRAGIRSETAPRTYYAIKTILTLLLPAVVGLLLTQLPLGLKLLNIAAIVVAISAAGYYLPSLYLRSRSKQRSGEMQDYLPDLIDLLLICVESGLGLDAAIVRVSKEMARSCPALAEEFHLAGLEIRAGAGRIEALKHMAERVNLDDLRSLVSMLVQADRFGTSLGVALRIHSEVMRVKRMQRAEELAIKIPVKILFPLIFCIFPSLLVTLIGPAAIQVAKMFGD